MPELPEVETICRYLKEGTSTSPAILGLTVESVQVLWARTLAAPGLEEFYRRMPGKIIENISRRGKFLRILLSGDTLLIHLRMSGDLLVESSHIPPAPHHRLLINFQNGLRLAFNDARKFGRVWLVADPLQVTGNLGPEPLDPEFTAEQFYVRLKPMRRQLKPLLLDQSFIAGLGNIYVDESLNLARLHPLEIAREVTEPQAKRLFDSIRQVLTEGIRRNGASIDWVYRGGEFQNYFRVYDRKGLPCPACGTPIQRIEVGQRGTHFCPHCQTLS